MLIKFTRLIVFFVATILCVLSGKANIRSSAKDPLFKVINDESGKLEKGELIVDEQNNSSTSSDYFLHDPTSKYSMTPAPLSLMISTSEVCDNRIDPKTLQKNNCCIYKISNFSLHLFERCYLWCSFSYSFFKNYETFNRS